MHAMGLAAKPGIFMARMMQSIWGPEGFAPDGKAVANKH